jgi:hypothetical protein
LTRPVLKPIFEATIQTFTQQMGFTQIMYQIRIHSATK